MYEILFNLIGKVFLLIILGYCLRKWGVITPEFHNKLNSFLMSVCVPASLMTSSSAPFSKEMSGNLLTIALITAACYLSTLGVSWLISRFLKLEKKEKNLFTSMAVFPNIAYVGFPLAMELLGSEGSLYNTIANIFYILFFFTIGASIITGQNMMSLKKLFKIPATVACLISIVIYFSPFRFPVFVQDTFSSVGGMMAPTAMILIGSSLAEIPVFSILKDRCAYLVSALRLIIYPFAILFILMAIPGVPATVALHTSLMFSVPTGTMCQIYAHEYDCHPDFAARTLVQGTLLMIITIPIFMTCAISLLGL